MCAVLCFLVLSCVVLCCVRPKTRFAFSSPLKLPVGLCIFPVRHITIKELRVGLCNLAVRDMSHKRFQGGPTWRCAQKPPRSNPVRCPAHYLPAHMDQLRTLSEGSTYRSHRTLMRGCGSAVREVRTTIAWEERFPSTPIGARRTKSTLYTSL